MSAPRFLLGTAGLLGLALLLPGGCVVTVDSIDDANGDGGEGGGDATDQITVRVINTSNVTLDPEIYVSAEPVSIEELFQRANKFRRYGVGTQGILADHDSDTFALACSDVRIIGTKGGTFGDDLDNPDGTGQQIILTQEYSVFCGGTVTFTYSGSGGEFTTEYNVQR